MQSRFAGFVVLALFSVTGCGGGGTSAPELVVEPANTAPSVSGTPGTSVAVAAAYAFTPLASDADGDALTFSIENKPSWATFDTETGALTGTPTYYDGRTRNIAITVSDGRSTVALPPFDIAVTGSCVSDSASPADTNTIIKSAPCGRYGTLATRKVSGEIDVIVEYMVHTPSSTPKAIAVLIPGGTGDSGIQGTGTTVTAAGNNFLVRSAQLFAQDGYLTITLDRPSDMSTPSSVRSYDDYRISARHALDIAAIVAAENEDNLDVFLVGTSRGALSAVANHQLAMAIAISSAVTSGVSPLTSTAAHYLGDGTANLAPEFVAVPTHMKIHNSDGCAVSAPANARGIFDGFTEVAGFYATAGVENHYSTFTGGFDMTGAPTGTGTNVIEIGRASCRERV